MARYEQPGILRNALYTVAGVAGLVGILGGCKGLSQMNQPPLVQNQPPDTSITSVKKSSEVEVVSIDGKKYIIEDTGDKVLDDRLSCEFHIPEEIDYSKTKDGVIITSKGYVPLKDPNAPKRFELPPVKRKGKYANLIEKITKAYRIKNLKVGKLDLNELPSVKALDDFPTVNIEGEEYLVSGSKQETGKLSFYLIKKEGTDIEVEKGIVSKNTSGVTLINKTEVYRPSQKPSQKPENIKQGKNNEEDTKSLEKLNTKENIPPIATGIKSPLSAEKNKTLEFKLEGTDPDGTEVITMIEKTPAKGKLSIIDDRTGRMTYEPEKDFIGPVEFSYVVFDGEDKSEPVTVRLRVIEPQKSTPPPGFKSKKIDAQKPNTKPVIKGPLGFITEPNKVKTFTVTGFDTDKDKLDIKSKTPKHGKVTTENLSDGRWGVTYTPAKDFKGKDKLEFTVSDGKEDSNTLVIPVRIKAKEEIKKEKEKDWLELMFSNEPKDTKDN